MKTANEFLDNAFNSSGGKDLSVEQKQAAQSFIFEFLKPKASPFPLIRLGGDGDGAYLVPDCLASIDACFSPGVANRKDFEDELYHRYGMRSHMCDFTSDLDSLRTELLPSQTFEKLWLDIEGENSIRLEDWVNRMEADSDRLMLQMDIEGAEYRNLIGSSISCLDKFKVCLIELHNLADLDDDTKLGQIMLPFFKKLSTTFCCIHAHPNNCSPDIYLPLIDERIPRVLELTLIHKSYILSAASLVPPILPNPLDIVNVKHQRPLFLSGSWLASSEPSSDSESLKTQQLLEYYQDPTNFTSVNSSNKSIRWVIEWASSARRLRMIEDLNFQKKDNRALGKRCLIRQSYLSNREESIVIDDKEKPYLFHTAFRNGQSVLVDLQDIISISALTLMNRLDTCQERAHTLFISFSSTIPESSEPNPSKSFLVDIPASFLSKPSRPHTIECIPTVARYIHFFSPAATALHFSFIHIS